MNTSDRTGCNHRKLTAKELRVADANLDVGEIAVLEMARYMFQSFARPETQGWIIAMFRPEHTFPANVAADIALKTLKFVQGMRESRRSCFQFNSPICVDCARILTEHERQLLGILVALRCGRVGQARVHAMVLCEGNETEYLLAAAQNLADALGERLLNGYNLRLEAV